MKAAGCPLGGEEQASPQASPAELLQEVATNHSTPVHGFVDE